MQNERPYVVMSLTRSSISSIRGSYTNSRLGKWLSGEAIYVASSACARAAAIALCSQLQNKEDAPRIIETFIELFRGDCRAVLTTNEKGHTDESSKSVWDDLDKIVKH